MEFGDAAAAMRSRISIPVSISHLICLSCGSVTEFSEDLLENLEKKVADECDFQIEDHQVKLFGYCKEPQALIVRRFCLDRKEEVIVKLVRELVSLRFGFGNEEGDGREGRVDFDLLSVRHAIAMEPVPTVHTDGCGGE